VPFPRVASRPALDFHFSFALSAMFERFIAGQFQMAGTMRGGGRFRHNCAATQ